MSALYRQVCEQILKQIASGQRKVGDRLPPESEFASELGISRSTLRLAFNELEACGIVQRRKRAGTQIIASEPKRRFNMATSGVQELLSLGSKTTFHIQSTSTVRTDDVELLNGHNSETGYWLDVFGSRTINQEDKPFSTNHVYVPARFSGIEPVLKTTQDSVFKAIEQSFDVAVTRVTQCTRAIACPKTDAQIMGLKAGAPVLKIDAVLYVHNNELMEVSTSIFDPDRFQLLSDVSID